MKPACGRLCAQLSLEPFCFLHAPASQSWRSSGGALTWSFPIAVTAWTWLLYCFSSLPPSALVNQKARRLSHGGSHAVEFWGVVGMLGKMCHHPHAEDPPCGHPTGLLTPSEMGQIRDVHLNALDVVLVCSDGNYLQSSCWVCICARECVPFPTTQQLLCWCSHSCHLLGPSLSLMEAFPSRVWSKVVGTSVETSSSVPLTAATKGAAPGESFGGK